MFLSASRTLNLFLTGVLSALILCGCEPDPDPLSKSVKIHAYWEEGWWDSTTTPEGVVLPQNWVNQFAHYRVIWQPSRYSNSPAIAHSSSEHVILVSGPAYPFRNTDEARLLHRSYLKARLAKQRVEPSRVQILRSADNVTIYFFFAVNDTTGTPVISPRETSVTFVCAGGEKTIKARFDPQKMAAVGWKLSPELTPP